MDPNENRERFLVYIDNSNVWISCKRYSAKMKKFRPPFEMDSCARVDMGKLYKIACNPENKNIERWKRSQLLPVKLYGSVPPSTDSLWTAIQKKEIDIDLTRKSTWSGRENQTDHNLIADAVDDMADSDLKAIAGENRTIILFTGDVGMMALVQKAEKHKCKIEVWSFELALSGEFLREAERNSNVTLYKLDDYFKKISFQSYEWRSRIPEDRSLVLMYDTKPWTSGIKEGKRFLRDISEAASKLFKLSVAACFINQDLPHVAVVCVPYLVKKGTTEQIYNFNRDIFGKRGDLMYDVGGSKHGLKIISFLEYKQNNGKVVDAYNCDVNDQSEEPDVEDLDFDDYVVLYRPPTKNPKPDCHYGFRCRLLGKCGHKHGDKEKEYFGRFKDGDRPRPYKMKPCIFPSCNFANTSYMCSGAHYVTETMCTVCKAAGDHYSFDCKLSAD